MKNEEWGRKQRRTALFFELKGTMGNIPIQKCSVPGKTPHFYKEENEETYIIDHLCRKGRQDGDRLDGRRPFLPLTVVS